MAKIEKFEDIEAWQKARSLVKEVYRVCGFERYKKDYNLIDQTRSSAISIIANIAEGYARRTNKEFINFLGMAHASAAELQSHLYVALDQRYISDQDFRIIYSLADQVSKMIQGFITYLKNSQTPKLKNSQLKRKN
ncbi:MAG: four helix bundle protein [Candidatus Marinimicrobia bacterium]|nr:four helix bundle protein [Candidatus Neomarinimicrobiota bacterium]